MPDITKCTSENGLVICPMRDKCYRYTSESSYRQSFWLKAPIKDGKCDEFWDNKEYIKNGRKKA